MNCRALWRMIQSTGYVASTFWSWVYGLGSLCAAQSCVWWLLCLNIIFCWIVTILLAVLMIVFFLLFIISAFVALVICELICIISVMLQTQGSMCFAYGPEPPATPPPPSSSSGGLTNPPTTPGTGTGTGTGTTTGTSDDNITSLSELDSAMSWGSLLTTFTPVRVQLSDASPNQSQHFESVLNWHLDACGCRQGKVGMLLALAAFALALVISPTLDPVGLGTAGTGVALTLFGAGLGKMFGLLRARVLLRQSVSELRSAWQLG